MNGTIFLGDVREQSNTLNDDYFQCIITSPPYFGLRNYSDDNLNEIGRETNLTDYVDHLVEIFSMLRPKLRNDGLLWLNLGDTYREKALLSIPWRVALALPKFTVLIKNLQYFKIIT